MNLTENKSVCPQLEAGEEDEGGENYNTKGPGI